MEVDSLDGEELLLAQSVDESAYAESCCHVESTTQDVEVPGYYDGVSDYPTAYGPAATYYQCEDSSVLQFDCSAPAFDDTGYHCDLDMQTGWVRLSYTLRSGCFA